MFFFKVNVKNYDKPLQSENDSEQSSVYRSGWVRSSRVFFPSGPRGNAEPNENRS